MTLAMQDVNQQIYSINKAAEVYCVPRSTLQTRLRGVRTRREAHEHQQLLSPAQENILVEWVKIMGRRGVPLSLTTTAEYASDIAGRPVGETWPRRFRQRHPDLRVRWTVALEECRARALNQNVVHNFFEMYSELMEKYEIQPQNLYNMDEKGIQLGVGKRSHAVLVDRDQKMVHSIQTGNRDLVTILECLSADGTALHPSVVFEGKRRDLRWGEVNPCNARLVLVYSVYTSTCSGVFIQ